MEQEQERQNLEMMKMSNQNILSGPPPDRLQPKPEDVPQKEQPQQDEQKQQEAPAPEGEQPVPDKQPQQDEPK